MKSFLGAVLLTALAIVPASPVRADDDAKAILDKAIKAIGGEDKLAKADALSWKGKGTITFNGNENMISTQVTVKGIDHYRSEFAGEFNGNEIKGVSVVNGDKGWRKFGDMAMDIEGDALVNEKRTLYLQVIPVTITPLKGKDFKVETASEEKVGDKPAVGLKITGPDGKEFKLFFDKESGLPVKSVAKVMGFNGEEFSQETTYGNYKDFDGIKKATKVASTRDGEKFIETEISDFKLIDKVKPDTFSEPQ